MTFEWKALRSPPISWQVATGVYHEDSNSIYIMSGHPLSDNYAFNYHLYYTFKYSIDADFWVPIASRPMNASRLFSSVQNLGNNYAIISGGMSVGYYDSVISDKPCFSQTVQIFDIGFFYYINQSLSKLDLFRPSWIRKNY